MKNSFRAKAKQQRHSKSRLAAASRAVIETMEARVLLSANPFTPGDIAVVQVGATGSSTALGDTGTATFIDEYTAAGTLVQQIALPTTSTPGGNQSLVLGNNTSEGELNLSTDGQDLLLAGYDTAVGGGGTTIENSTSASISRTIAEISASGSIDTTTALTDFSSAGDPRGVVGSDANGFWAAGQDATSGGVRYISALGSTVTTSTNLAGATVKNARSAEIWNGQLYIAQNKVTTAPIIEALDTATTGSLQTSGTGTTINALPGTGTTNLSTPGTNAKTGAFFFAKLGSSADFQINGTDSGYNTLYVADADTHTSGSSPGIAKYSWTGTSWASNGTIGSSALSFEGVIGSVSGSTVTLYTTVVNPITGTDGIDSITDNSGFNATITNKGSTTPTVVVAAAPTNTVFRGISFAPEDGAQAIGGLAGTTNYIQGTAATVIGGSATFTDSSSFNGGSLVVSGGQTGDLFSINNQGTGAGQIGVSGSNITYAGTQIGTFSGGTGTTALTITFDSVVNTNGTGATEFAVTSTAVQALINQITFSSSGATGNRTVTFTVNKNSATNAAGAYGTLSTPASDVASATQTVKVNLSGPIVYSYVTDQSTYTIGVGQTVTVNIYLQETLNGDTSIIDGNGENGLAGAGFKVTIGTQPASPSLITDASPDTSTGAVTGATNASPIVITTADTSGIFTGSSVVLSGVKGNTAANNTVANPYWFAKVLSPTTFALYKDAAFTIPVAGNHAWTAGSGQSWLGDFGGLQATNVDPNGIEADILEGTSASGVGVETGNGAPTTDVFLGSLTITGGSSAGTTTFNLGEYNAGGGNTITDPDGDDLDISGSVNGVSYTGVGSALTGFSVITTGASLPTPTVTVTSGNMVYNGNPYTPTTTVTGTNGADASATETYTYYTGTTATGTPLSGAPSSVGTYTVVANFAGDSTYAAASSAPNTFMITAKSLTPSIVATNKTYDGTNTASVTYNLAGIVGSDVVTANGTATFSDKNVGTGITVTATGISLSGAAAGNYSLSSTSATTTANITALAITGNITANNKTFDGTTAATIATRTLTGVIGGDTVTYVGGTATFASTGPGTGITVTATGLSLSGADAGNYTVNATATTTANITSGALPTPTVTVTSGDSVYNGNAYTPTTTVTGTSGTDGSATETYTYYAGNTATGTPLSGAPTSVGTYTVVASFAGDSTYAAANSAPKTFNITAKSLTPSIVATNRTYDRTTAASVTYNLAGIVGSDVVTANGTATFSDKNVGTGKTVTATGISLSGSAASNYSLSSTSATTTANITALAITGNITANNKTFDGTTAATIATRTLTGVISGDTVTYVGGTATFASTGPGAGILVTATGLSLSGADAGNYTVNATATTTADITVGLPTPTVTVTSGDRVYNGSPYVPTTLVTGGSGDDTTGAVTYTYYAGSTATGTPLPLAPQAVATYTVVANFAGDSTYAAASSAPDTFQITAASLTATIMASNKTYNGTTAANVIYSLSGIIGSDRVSANGTATFSDKNVGTGKTVTATGITLSGAAAGNYSLSSTSATTTANITAKAITGSITASSKVFDGTTAATIATRTLSGVIGGDSVSYVGGTATFANTGPGTAILVTATGLSLSGADAGNYTVNTTATTTANITSKTKSVITAHAATLKGQEGRVASGTIATFTDSNKTLLANSFSATIAWGDGTTSTGTVVRTAAGAFKVTASHAYAQDKPSGYAVKVSIQGTDGSAGTVNSLAQIVDSPLDEASNLLVYQNANVSFTNKHLGTFRDQDSLNTNPGNYTGTINWGDGTTSKAAFAFDHSAFNVGSYWIVEGSHKYTTKKTYKVTITLHDNDSPTKLLIVKVTIQVL